MACIHVHAHVWFIQVPLIYTCIHIYNDYDHMEHNYIPVAKWLKIKWNKMYFNFY